MSASGIGGELRCDQGKDIVRRALRSQGSLERRALRLRQLVQLLDKSLELRRFHRALPCQRISKKSMLLRYVRTEPPELAAFTTGAPLPDDGLHRSARSAFARNYPAARRGSFAGSSLENRTPHLSPLTQTIVPKSRLPVARVTPTKSPSLKAPEQFMARPPCETSVTRMLSRVPLHLACPRMFARNRR